MFIDDHHNRQTRIVGKRPINKVFCQGGPLTRYPSHVKGMWSGILWWGWWVVCLLPLSYPAGLQLGFGSEVIFFGGGTLFYLFIYLFCMEFLLKIHFKPKGVWNLQETNTTLVCAARGLSRIRIWCR